MDGDLENVKITYFGISKWEIKQNSVCFDQLTSFSFVFN